MEIDGPIFQLDDGETTKQQKIGITTDESSGVVSTNDNLLEKIKKVKTSRDAVRVCEEILDSMYTSIFIFANYLIGQK